jgi:hypothetical protein
MMINLFNIIKYFCIICIIGPLYIAGFILGYCLRAFINGGLSGYIYMHTIDNNVDNKESE